MNLRPPNGDNITKLLLLCAPTDVLSAPTDVLTDIELTEETATEFAEIFDAMDSYYQVNNIALALYYANRTLVNYQKSHSIMRVLYFSPEVIQALVQTVDAESFGMTDKLKDEIVSFRNKKAGIARHGQPNNTYDIKNKVLDYYRKDIDKSLSAPKAAEKLMENVVKPNYFTLSIRKLEDYVREEKKRK